MSGIVLDPTERLSAFWMWGDPSDLTASPLAKDPVYMIPKFAKTQKISWKLNAIQSYNDRTYAVTMAMVNALTTFHLVFCQDESSEPDVGFDVDQFSDLTLVERLSTSPVKKVTSKEKRAGVIPCDDPKEGRTINFLFNLGRGLELIMEYTEGARSGAKLVEYIRVKISEGYPLDILMGVLNDLLRGRVSKVHDHVMMVVKHSGTVHMDEQHFWYHRCQLDWTDVKVVEEIVPDVRRIPT